MCGFEGFIAGLFMLSLALLFFLVICLFVVVVFVLFVLFSFSSSFFFFLSGGGGVGGFIPFIIVITSLGEGRTGLCASCAFVCLFVTR